MVSAGEGWGEGGGGRRKPLSDCQQLIKYNTFYQ